MKPAWLWMIVAFCGLASASARTWPASGSTQYDFTTLVLVGVAIAWAVWALRKPRQMGEWSVRGDSHIGDDAGRGAENHR